MDDYAIIQDLCQAAKEQLDRLRAAQQIAGSIGTVLVVKDQCVSQSINFRIDESYLRDKGPLLISGEGDSITVLEQSYVSEDILELFQRLSSMIQDTLVICFASLPGQELHVHLPSDCLGTWERCDLWLLGPDLPLVTCVCEATPSIRVRCQGITCDCPGVALMPVLSTAAAAGAGVASIAQGATIAATTNGLVYAVSGAMFSLTSGFAIVAGIGAGIGLGIGCYLQGSASSQDSSSQPIARELSPSFVLDDGGGSRSTGCVAENAWDNDPSTFYDSLAASGGFTAADLGSSQHLGCIQFVAKKGFAHSMIGGKFEATDDLFGHWWVLHLITEEPLDNPCVNTVPLDCSTRFRYLRYFSSEGSHCMVACIRVFAAEIGGTSTEGSSQ
eukprot:TRINITY_DN13273_c0_g1_i1.p1 TRINITY_DN13273_c0_g1~~TRINITY_DN13273_c0_g1_i1.p1  ORF type:complete len:387 (-),score=55.39 TRINITY_DN13273_c0_g1_i1:76-1236(-)